MLAETHEDRVVNCLRGARLHRACQLLVCATIARKIYYRETTALCTLECQGRCQPKNTGGEDGTKTT